MKKNLFFAVCQAHTRKIKVIPYSKSDQLDQPAHQFYYNQIKLNKTISPYC